MTEKILWEHTLTTLLFVFVVTLIGGIMSAIVISGGMIISGLLLYGMVALFVMGITRESRPYSVEVKRENS